MALAYPLMDLGVYSQIPQFPSTPIPNCGLTTHRLYETNIAQQCGQQNWPVKRRQGRIPMPARARNTYDEARVGVQQAIYRLCGVAGDEKVLSQNIRRTAAVRPTSECELRVIFVSAVLQGY